jgi:hypothetical protein
VVPGRQLAAAGRRELRFVLTNAAFPRDDGVSLDARRLGSRNFFRGNQLTARV